MDILPESSINSSRFFNRSHLVGIIAIAIICAIVGLFFYELAPVKSINSGATASTSTVVFEIKSGDGFRTIANNLASEQLIRSKIAFEAFALLGGRALAFKPGLYQLSPSMSSDQIIHAISQGNAGEVMVTIPEGSNIYEIDGILSAALVIHPGDLINFKTDGALEGKLFPDTYQFYTNSNVKDVVDELIGTFNTKAAPLLALDPKNAQQNLIIASILEKEVPDQADQEVVAGIILKRLAAKMPLDIDATVCYAKFIKEATSSPSCYPLSALDFKIDSPYNSYLYGGLPSGPIGNPGVSAITAALHPATSSYWYYLSDPKTGKTIFAKTLDEQTRNKVKYLENY